MDLSSRAGHTAFLFTLLLLTLVWQPLYAAETAGEKLVNRGDSVSLNFKDTDIRTLTAIVAEATGKNFVIDPRVKGNVTVISSRPMDEGELYQVYLSILQVHGFAAVESGEVIKILPDATARTESIPTEGDQERSQGDLLVTRVLQIDHVAAVQLVPILRPLIPKEGHLAAYAASNVLIVSDRSANVGRLLRIVHQIDRPLDDSVEMIPLEHAPAGDVARLLSSLYTEGKDKGSQNQPKAVADEWTNSVLIGGDQLARLKLRALISHLDTPRNAAASVTRVVHLQHAKASELAELLNGVAGNLTNETGASKKEGETGAAHILADDQIHALVITAPQAIFKQLQEVISQLDLPRAQVLVEAVVAEISSDKANELGIQWRLNTDLDSGGSGAMGGTAFDTGSTSIGTAMSKPLALGSGLSIGWFNGTSSVLGTDYLNIGALLHAMSGDGRGNILSTPTLVVRDNEEAEIVVGQNVPFLTGSYTSTGSGSTPTNPFQTIERKDIGLTLKVKPRITEGNVVKLDIEQEVSSVSATSVAGASDLVTNKRSIRTSVSVHDGRVVVLGGLIDDNLQESEQKVPLLGDVPLLGQLFRSRRTTLVKRNLMVFIRPVILRDQLANDSETSGRYDRMRDAQREHNAAGVQLIPGAMPPLLPPAGESAATQPFSTVIARPQPVEPEESRHQAIFKDW